MWKTQEGSTGRLLQLCLGYFVFYVITGVAVKYFTEYPDRARAAMKDAEFLVYSTLGGSLVCLFVVFALGWYRLQSNGHVRWCGLTFPREYVYIIPSGVCTAIVIPTTTLMYMLPISVMVAMVIMRGAVIVISLLVDLVQKWQGILTKKIYWQESVAVLFAIGAVCTKLFLGKKRGGEFDFVRDPAAMTILGSYILAYCARIYIMNYFKNTRGKGVKQDNTGFFAIEQIAASVAMTVVAAFILAAPSITSWTTPNMQLFHGAIRDPRPMWGWATFAGTFYGLVAFCSVFIFIFKGRTATFAGLVNRLTSLVAGTTATLVSGQFLGAKFPTREEWYALGLILVAVGFLAFAERRRAVELAVAGQLAPATGASIPVGPPKS